MSDFRFGSTLTDEEDKRIRTWLRKVPTDATHLPATRIVMLTTSGAFSPIHLGHIGLLHRCKALLEDGKNQQQQQQQQQQTHVLHSFVIPSTDSYVSGKLGKDAIPHRIRCELGELATSDDPFVTILPWQNASGGDCASRTQRMVELTNYIALRPDQRLAVVPVYGSDFYNRCPQCIMTPTCFYGRKDSDGSTEKAKRHIARASPASKHPDFMFVEDVDESLAVPDISSTMIRGVIKEYKRAVAKKKAKKEEEASAEDDDDATTTKAQQEEVRERYLAKLKPFVHAAVAAKLLH